MRILWLIVLVVPLAVSGCARKRGTPSKAGESKLIVTPGKATGRVAAVNTAGRFVVVTFPPGAAPARDRRLHAFRAGLKVADLRPTEWQQDLNWVADIMSGECQVGDEVREE